MEEKDKTIIRDYIKSCSDHCYCKLAKRCENCIGKEYLIAIGKLLEKGSLQEKEQ